MYQLMFQNQRDSSFLHGPWLPKNNSKINTAKLLNSKINIEKFLRHHIHKIQYHQFTNHKYHSFFDQEANREGIEEPLKV